MSSGISAQFFAYAQKGCVFSRKTALLSAIYLDLRWILAIQSTD